MLFQMLSVFLAVVAFVGIDGRAFGNALQQRQQVVALMGIGGSDVQFPDIAFLIGAGMLFVTEFVEAVFLLSNGHRCLYSVWFDRRLVLPHQLLWPDAACCRQSE